MILVNKPFMPPIGEYQKYLDAIWNNEWLTNNGPFVQKLESSLKKELKLNHLLFVSNGTIALQFAIKALDIKNEVITTPFSYVATASSIVWEGCTPVFVDIDPDTWNIDTSLIERAITKKTTAILATHVFGNPCDIGKIEEIAKKHNLKIIYDAAHCYGVKYKEKSVLQYGDISTISFHATKLLHTVEGGGIVFSDQNLFLKLKRIRNFGHDGPEKFSGLGINGKNSEFHAAMGLVNLKYADNILDKRKQDHEFYDKNIDLNQVKKQIINPLAKTNYSYYPLVFDSESSCKKTLKVLLHNEISGRRYFYPSLNKLEYVNFKKMPVAEKIARSIICLPLYYDLTIEEIAKISRIMNDSLSSIR